MSNKVGYALLIHGCPFGVAYNVTSAELAYFADFIADGGVFESSLASWCGTEKVDTLVMLPPQRFERNPFFQTPEG